MLAGWNIDYRSSVTHSSFPPVSLVVFILIGIFLVSEFKYYTSTELKFDYEVDTEPDK